MPSSTEDEWSFERKKSPFSLAISLFFFFWLRKRLIVKVWIFFLVWFFFLDIRVKQRGLFLSSLFFSLERSLEIQGLILFFKGPYADHILIPQGSTGGTTFFDIKWKPIFFYLQIQNFSFKFLVVLEIWQTHVKFIGIPENIYIFFLYFHNNLIPRGAYFLFPLESKQEATSGWNFTKCISEVKVNQLKVKNKHIKMGISTFKSMETQPPLNSEKAQFIRNSLICTHSFWVILKQATPNLSSHHVSIAHNYLFTIRALYLDDQSMCFLSYFQTNPW